MRLGTITLLVLLLLLALILLFPALFLESTATIIPEEYQKGVGDTLAGISMMTGRPMTAVSVYDLYIMQGKGTPEVYQKKSEALIAAGDYAGALAALEQVIASDPENIILLNTKARLLIREGRVVEAESVYDRILGIKTDMPSYLTIIGDITLKRSLYLDAYRYYTRVLELDPGDGLTWEKRSDVIFALLTIPTAGASAPGTLKTQDLYTEGITGYENAISLLPDRKEAIRTKIEKRSSEYVAKTIQELQDRYQEFRYLQPGEKPLPTS